MRKFRSLLPLFLVAIASLLVSTAHAQDASSDGNFTKEQLDQILAPIALYPDDLLSNILMASTYPLEVIQAARWRKEPQNAKLEGDALSKALEAKDWDPSVKALTVVPDVLETMSEELEWTQKLGDAFLAQQDEVMAEIQFLRQKAEEADSLKSNEQQKVTKEENYIVIEQTSPDVVYVPVYEPTVVYGTWWYPDYPPYYWYWGHPTSAFVRGFFWGAGYAVARSIWGWGRCDWRRNQIDIDVNRYNQINVNRAKITSNTWKHNPVHRGPVPYRTKEARQKFGKDRPARAGREEFRGFDKDNIKGRLGEDAGQKLKDKVGNGAGEKLKDKVGSGAGEKLKDKAGGKAGGKLKDKAAGAKPKVTDRAKDSKPKAAERAKKAKPKVTQKPAAKKPAKKKPQVKKPAAKKPQVKKPTAKKPVAKKHASSALNVKKGSNVKRNANRGHSSMKVSRGGGGRGGGGRGGGGRGRR